MLLKSIKLENIRSYAFQNISLNNGSTLLLGDIGSGKTTILLAIEFALFGLIKGDISGDTLLRHGKKEGSVELNIEIDTKNITIVRRLKKKNDSISQDSGHIIIDGKKIEGTPVELKSKVLELCGYPQDLINKNTSLIYRYTVYTPQEDMKAILFETKEERLDILRKIFNIDKYKRVRENALNYAKELRNYKKILENKIIDLEDKKMELKNKKLAIDNIDKQKQDIQTRIVELRSSITNKDEEAKKFEEEIKELNTIKKDIAVLESNLKNKKAESEKNIKELGIVEYRIREYENKLKDLGLVDQNEEDLKKILAESEDKLTKINAAKEIVKGKLDSKQEDLKKLVINDQASLKSRNTSLVKKIAGKKDIENNLEDSKALLEKTNIELNTLKINKNNSEKIINQLKDLSTCPVCLQKVDFTHKIKITDTENFNINGAQKKIEEMQKRKLELETLIQTNDKYLEELRKDELELREVIIKLDNLSSQIEAKQNLEKEIEDLKMKKEKLEHMDITKLVEVISKSRKMLSNMEVRKHIEESLKDKKEQMKTLKNSMEVANTDLGKMNEEYNALSEKSLTHSEAEKSFLNIKKDRDLLNQNLQSEEIKNSGIEKEKAMTTDEINKISQDIETKTKIKEKINYVNELNFWINEQFINLTSTIEKTIMQKIHREFNDMFKKWFQIMMDDSTMDVRIDEEFTPIVSQNNYETEIVNLSGGEKTAVALAYRLSLNKVINDFISNIKTKEIIILDEPTDGFSSEQLDKMRDVFDELRIGQMIIVSHETKMESYVQNIIKISKQDHNSTASI